MQHGYVSVSAGVGCTKPPCLLASLVSGVLCVIVLCLIKRCKDLCQFFSWSDVNAGKFAL